MLLLLLLLMVVVMTVMVLGFVPPLWVVPGMAGSAKLMMGGLHGRALPLTIILGHRAKVESVCPHCTHMHTYQYTHTSSMSP